MTTLQTSSSPPRAASAPVLNAETPAPPGRSSAKDLSIETLRGLGIILVVLCHAIGTRPDSGLKLGDGNIYRWTYEFIHAFNMPMFAALAGYFHHRHPAERGRFGRYLGNKAWRLLVPMAVVSTLQYVAMALAEGNAAERLGGIYWIYIDAYAQFWFLQALFLVIVVVGLLDLAGVTRSIRGLTVATLLAAAFYVFPIVDVDLFSFWGMRRLLPFFLLGCLFAMIGGRPLSKPFHAVAWLTLAVTFAVWQAEWLDQITPATSVMRAVRIGFAASMVALIFQHRRHVALLSWVGALSFSIYLLHMFGVTGARTLLKAAGVESVGVLLPVCVLAGLVAPIVVDWAVLRRSRLLQHLVLGAAPAWVSGRKRPVTITVAPITVAAPAPERRHAVE